MHFRWATEGRKYDECSEFEESFSQLQQNENVIDIGLQAEKLVNTTNRTCQGFIMICYINSLFSITNFAFQLVANVSLNETHSTENRVVLTFLYIHALLLYLVRLDILMQSGQTLENPTCLPLGAQTSPCTQTRSWTEKRGTSEGLSKPRLTPADFRCTPSKEKLLTKSQDV